jgi:hypothetical protein
MVMKAGTDTGSVINHIYSRMTKGAPEPVEGMDATVLGWTDRYGGKVTKTWASRGNKTFVEVDTDHGVYTFRRPQDGAWQQVRLSQDTNRWVRAARYGLILGISDPYEDPHF